MNVYVLTALCGLGLAAGSSLAQENPPPQQPPQPPPPQEREAPPPPPSQTQPQQQVDVSDAEMQKFAEIYVDVQETRDELSSQLRETESQESAQEIQARMRDAITDTIEQHDWSVEKYNRVATAINNDPDMREEALERINDLSS